MLVDMHDEPLLPWKLGGLWPDVKCFLKEASINYVYKQGERGGVSQMLTILHKLIM